MQHYTHYNHDQRSSQLPQLVAVPSWHFVSVPGWDQGSYGDIDALGDHPPWNPMQLAKVDTAFNKYTGSYQVQRWSSVPVFAEQHHDHEMHNLTSQYQMH